jgi:hypothetical protein
MPTPASGLDGKDLRDIERDYYLFEFIFGFRVFENRGASYIAK